MHTPLTYTKEANHRIFVGLSWDPTENESLLKKLGAKIIGQHTHHDLDLGCVFYNADMTPLGTVNANPDQASDKSGAIYHSGDNTEGVGDGDDEEISVELKTLPHDIHHIIFYTSIATGQNFDTVNAPEIHLSDAYTRRKILHVNLQAAMGNDYPAFALCHIYRHGEDWAIEEISQFLDNTDDWANTLSEFIQK